MLNSSQSKRIQKVKKLASSGKAGLFLATCIIAVSLFFEKLWSYIRTPFIRIVYLLGICLAFFITASFAPVELTSVIDTNAAMATESALVSTDTEDSSVEKEVYTDKTDVATIPFSETESLDEADFELLLEKAVPNDDQMAGLEDLKASQDSSNIEQDVQEVTNVSEVVFNKSDWNLLLVNKQHSIPENYTFTLGTIKGQMKCDERIIEPLTNMFEAARGDGVNLVVCSPYRDLSRQEYLFDRKMKSYLNQGLSYMEAYREASAVVTVPGTSEHQLGLALDIICDSYAQLNEGFGETAAGKWLMDNSYKYGFILRYPKDKEDITGIIYEPWHYRYVGVEAATFIHNKKICLEEFIEEL